MKIKSRKEAAEIRHDGKQKVLQLWDVGAERATLDGVDFEFIREPEPVVMYTGEQIRSWVRAMRMTTDEESISAYESIITRILARRAEMLRAMGSEELVEQVTGLTYRYSAREVIALVTEHIEANRPELTEDVIDGWLREFKGHGPDAALSSLGSFIAHRAAEYRSPAKSQISIGEARELALAQLEITELRAENERLKKHADTTGDLETIVRHMGLGVGDYSSVAEQIRETGDCYFATISRTRSPQPVDDSDEYGILVQDGCVAIVRRVGGAWTSMLHVRGRVFGIDPSRIFKVTSQPRGPLKVPSGGEIEDMTHAQVGHMQSLRRGAQWTIERIKEANGAE